MTVSLPQTLLDRIDKLARAENRTRSNWVVTELDDIAAVKLNVPKLFSEAGESISADAGGPSGGTTRAYPIALPEPPSDPRLNEQSPAERRKPAGPRTRSTRAGIRKTIEREKGS